MFTGCFIVLLCLLLGGSLEARPLPMKQMEDTEEQPNMENREDYVDHRSAPGERPKDGIPLSPERISAPEENGNIFLKKNGNRGDIRPHLYIPRVQRQRTKVTPPYTPTAEMVIGSTSSAQTYVPKHRIKGVHRLKDRIYREESMIPTRAPKEGSGTIKGVHRLKDRIYREKSMIPPRAPKEGSGTITGVHHLKDRIFSEEHMIQPRAQKEESLMDTISSFFKWILIGLAILAFCFCVMLRYLGNFCDKHADKIPFDKLIALHAKPEVDE